MPERAPQVGEIRIFPVQQRRMGVTAYSLTAIVPETQTITQERRVWDGAQWQVLGPGPNAEAAQLRQINLITDPPLVATDPNTVVTTSNSYTIYYPNTFTTAPSSIIASGAASFITLTSDGTSWTTGKFPEPELPYKLKDIGPQAWADEEKGLHIRIENGILIAETKKKESA